VLRAQRKTYGCLLTLIIGLSLPSLTAASGTSPFYLGVQIGYGSTLWGIFAPTTNSQSLALAVAAPIQIQEGGLASGVILGYEPLSTLSIEANYLHYPTAKVQFAPVSLYSTSHQGRTTLLTHTETYNLTAKLLMLLPKTNWRLFSGAGMCITHRADEVLNEYRATPTFILGATYALNPRVMMSIEGSATAGFGKSELNPTADYVPFLYALLAKFAYRLG
jgi:hypothetical protein